MKKSCLGLGIVGIFVGIFIVAIGLMIGLYMLIVGSMKSHAVYRMGMELVRNDPAVTEMFGTPIQDGFFVGGSTRETQYGSGTANLSTTITGPKASGEVQINGYKPEGGEWKIQDIRIRKGNRQVLIYIGSEPEKGFQAMP